LNAVASKSRPTKKGNVIFVAFGPGHAAGGAAAAHAPPPPPPAAPEPNEGVTAFFTAAEAARLCGVTRARLRGLDRAGIAPPTGRRGGKRYYTFRDLIVLRAASGLLARHVRTVELAAAVRALRLALPEGAAPLSRLRIVSDGKRILVRDGTRPFEAVTGQTVLDFEVRTLRDDVVRMLRPADSGRRVHEAYELYVRASALDEAPETLAEAEDLYRRAIGLDPWLAMAYTNLGNVKFRQGHTDEALVLYEKALALDAHQPEAQYNVGYVLLERGQPAAALPHLEASVRGDGTFADAYFYLAMAHESVGQGERAAPHWQRYLALEPEGPWADIARRHLEGG
jgi:tetratricopeptide (TPR) repeat protein